MIQNICKHMLIHFSYKIEKASVDYIGGKKIIKEEQGVRGVYAYEVGPEVSKPPFDISSS